MKFTTEVKFTVTFSPPGDSAPSPLGRQYFYTSDKRIEKVHEFYLKQKNLTDVIAAFYSETSSEPWLNSRRKCIADFVRNRFRRMSDGRYSFRYQDCSRDTNSLVASREYSFVISYEKNFIGIYMSREL